MRNLSQDPYEFVCIGTRSKLVLYTLLCSCEALNDGFIVSLIFLACLDNPNSLHCFCTRLDYEECQHHLKQQFENTNFLRVILG